MVRKMEAKSKGFLLEAGRQRLAIGFMQIKDMGF